MENPNRRPHRTNTVLIFQVFIMGRSRPSEWQSRIVFVYFGHATNPRLPPATSPKRGTAFWHSVRHQGNGDFPTLVWRDERGLPGSVHETCLIHPRGELVGVWKSCAGCFAVQCCKHPGRAQSVELPHVFSDVTTHCGEAHGHWRGSPTPPRTRDRRSLPSRSLCNRGPIRAGSGDPQHRREDVHSTALPFADGWE